VIVTVFFGDNKWKVIGPPECPLVRVGNYDEMMAFVAVGGWEVLSHDGTPIDLRDLRYWSVDDQVAFVDPADAVKYMMRKGDDGEVRKIDRED